MIKAHKVVSNVVTKKNLSRIVSSSTQRSNSWFLLWEFLSPEERVRKVGQRRCPKWSFSYILIQYFVLHSLLVVVVCAPWQHIARPLVGAQYCIGGGGPSQHQHLPRHYTGDLWSPAHHRGPPHVRANYRLTALRSAQEDCPCRDSPRPVGDQKTGLSEAEVPPGGRG